MTDEQASSLITRSLAVDQQIAQLRVNYIPIFSKAVPGKVVAPFFQLRAKGSFNELEHYFGWH